MTKHTNEDLVFTWGAIETATGVSIAKMARDEPRTSPTERDANARRLVQIWNLWPDVVALLQNLYTDWAFHDRLDPDTIGLLRDMLKRMEEVP